MMNQLRKSVAVLLLVLCAGGTACPVWADEAALQKELESLKKRLQSVEDELAKSKKETSAKPVKNAEAVTTGKGTRVTVSGFAETRITNIANPSGDRVKASELDFQVTRFRPRFNFAMDEHFLGSIQLNASSRSAFTGGATSVNVRDVYLDYANAGNTLRFGQQKIPFGWEVFRQGDETAYTLERARVFGMMFPDERDIGLVATNGTAKDFRSSKYFPASIPTKVILGVGVVNGEGVNKSDANTGKSVAANAIAPLGKNHVVGASVYSGASSRVASGAAVTRSKEAVGVEHRFMDGRLTTLAEYLWGRSFAKDLNGGYAMAAYDTGKRGAVFIRHDGFDPDTDRGADFWSRTSVGWFKNFSPQIRVTAEYDFVRNKATRTQHDNTFGVEFQANF